MSVADIYKYSTKWSFSEPSLSNISIFTKFLNLDLAILLRIAQIYAIV